MPNCTGNFVGLLLYARKPMLDLGHDPRDFLFLEEEVDPSYVEGVGGFFEILLQLSLEL